MAKRYEIKHINDVLTLDEEQFERFLPDFKLWFARAKEGLSQLESLAKECGLDNAQVCIKTNGLVWVDDGCNEIQGASVTVNVFKQKEEQNNEKQ